MHLETGWRVPGWWGRWVLIKRLLERLFLFFDIWRLIVFSVIWSFWLVVLICLQFWFWFKHFFRQLKFDLFNRSEFIINKVSITDPFWSCFLNSGSLNIDSDHSFTKWIGFTEWNVELIFNLHGERICFSIGFGPFLSNDRSYVFHFLRDPVTVESIEDLVNLWFWCWFVLLFLPLLLNFLLLVCNIRIRTRVLNIRRGIFITILPNNVSHWEAMLFLSFNTQFIALEIFVYRIWCMRELFIGLF